MRRATTLLALCLLFAVAGCAALSGGNGVGTGEEPPGVEDGQLVDAEALADAHVEAMNESGFSHESSLDRTRTVDGEPTETSLTQRTSVAPGATAYTYRVRSLGAVSWRSHVWGNETVEYSRGDWGGMRQTGSGPPADARTLAGVELLEPHLTAPYEVVETREADGGDDTETDGGTLTVLEASDRPTSDEGFPDEATDVRNYDATLVVDRDGRIRSLEVTAEYDIEGEPADYRLSYEVTDVGDPGVTRPFWVDDVEPG